VTPTAQALVRRIEALDDSLFSVIRSQTDNRDRRALLALHSAVAATTGQFTYLEIGSYMGGSLQVVIQESRCVRILSIDARPVQAPDKRAGAQAYEDNSTERMLGQLRRLPAADLTKLSTFETGTDAIDPDDLPARPDYCFIDGEHTDAAALRDARFCAEAIEGTGVIAFHDCGVVAAAIREFLRGTWENVSRVVVFSPNASPEGGGVLAVELGDQGILRHDVIDRAVGSTWHSGLWRLTSLPRRTPGFFLAAWSITPAIDSAIARTRSLVRRPKAAD
jgi:Methyltransferase domain